ncbi:MAG: 1,4-dihydroxy-2-naphthoate octaprenyltransferase [Muribaculum sp.]|nr:1,4-dihydroxy-2-naphthoate octaprenyltransferase [Muribaculum sp.]
MINPWIEAMRLRTLPVSVAGVVAAVGYNVLSGTFRALPAALCLVFAVLAQIASNFANEYYDYRDGLDKVGRDGPRRGVTEGDITPEAMKRATFLTLGLACAVGCSLIYWGGWWLLVAGVFIAAGALAYSAGPYPLSRHCLGEVAVMLFFGIIPVNLTYYVQAGFFSPEVAMGSVGLGFMIANVLVVNNYRDTDDDASVGKHTLAVVFGRKFASTLYLFNGFLGIIFMWGVLSHCQLLAYAYGVIHLILWKLIDRKSGRALNPMLGATAMLIFLFALSFCVWAVCAA